MSYRKDWLVAAFGGEPRESTKYRLPLSIALLVSFILFITFTADRGLSDAAILALVVFFVCNSVGDRIWPTNVRAAAWIRLAGAGSVLAGAVAFPAHLYVERSWILLLLALPVISVALIFWVQMLGDRVQEASGDSPTE